jgi:transposase
MGCDVHLDTVTASVVDGVGAELASLTVPNRVSGWNRLIDLAQAHQVGLVGVEGASGYGRGLAVALTGGGVEVREIPTRVTARGRHADGAGKTDPGDARTVARAAARGEGHGWENNPSFETIRVLTARRDHLVRSQTSDINHLRALLAELDPELSAGLGRLRSTRSFGPLTRLEVEGDPYQQTLIQLVQDIAQDCLRRLQSIHNLENRIAAAMPPLGQHLIATFPGCGTVVAGQLIAQLAGTSRFASSAKFAAWTGTAPLDASSGRQQRHRLNRRGNRQANRALHTIILTQHRLGGETTNYINRRISQGKTRKEAIRAAKRHLARRIWKTIQQQQLT